MKPTLVAPYTINWNLGIQRELAKGTVLEVRYVGNQGHRAWRTSNLNEVNIFENGFLTEFKNAQNNLTINQANGKGATFANNGFAGQVNLPIFDAAFGPRGTVPAIAAASGYSNPTFVTALQQGAAGALANTLAANQNYVCRMFGNSFSPCTQARIQPSATQSYNAPGSGYPINFFVANPYSSNGTTNTLAYVDDSGWSSYNGLQIQLRKQFSHGLTWSTNYTYSKSLTNLPADSSIQNADYLTWRNTSLDRRPSLFDQKHAFQTFGTYDLPIGKGKKLAINNRILDSLIGGWTTGSILQWSTGTPFQLSGGFNTFNNQASGVQLAPGVTLDEIAAMFHDQPLQKINQTGNSNPLLARAGATDLTRLGVPLSLVGPDGRANPQFIVPNSTPGTLGQILYIYGKNNFQLGRFADQELQDHRAYQVRNLRLGLQHPESPDLGHAEHERVQHLIRNRCGAHLGTTQHDVPRHPDFLSLPVRLLTARRLQHTGGLFVCPVVSAAYHACDFPLPASE